MLKMISKSTSEAAYISRHVLVHILTSSSVRFNLKKPIDFVGFIISPLLQFVKRVFKNFSKICKMNGVGLLGDMGVYG